MSALTRAVDVAIDAIASFAGSKLFLVLHVLWFGTWLPTGGFGIDPRPWGTLTLIVSLEAIFLSTLILMSSKRQEAHDRAAADVERAQVAEIDDLEQEDKHMLRHLHGLVSEMHEIVVRADPPAPEA